MTQDAAREDQPVDPVEAPEKESAPDSSADDEFTNLQNQLEDPSGPRCSECRAVNADNARFCGRCGQRLMQAATTLLGARQATKQAAASEPDGDTTLAHVNFSATPAHYRIIEHIGSGGMGTVYLAKDEHLDRFVALKLLSKALMDSSEMKARLFREAKSIASLSHPNIVQVIAFGDNDDAPFVTMEYVAGPGMSASMDLPHPPLSLQEKVRRDGTMPARDAVDFVRKISSAMAYAHSRGVIHRDLKPANVLLTESGDHKIVDFGLARTTNEDELRLTNSGARIVSLGYGAPEQETDVSKADERADIYSLGGVLFFCLTGENPRFFRENKVPQYLRPIMSRALAKAPSERWQTVNELAHALAQAELPSPTISPAPTRSSLWRCKWCDTPNNLDTRFCAECGWDGGENCAECGEITRVGIRFCGECGSDIRSFNEIRKTVDAIRQDYAGRRFDRVIEQTDGLTDFQPTRIAGRELVSTVQELKSKSLKARERIAELKTNIDRANKLGAYERVQDLIAAHDQLDEGDAFAELKKGLPEKVRLARVSSNLAAAKEATRRKDWRRAESLCRTIVDELDARHGEARRMRGKLVRRRVILQITKLVAIVLAAGAFYAMTLPAFYLYVQKKNPDTALDATRQNYSIIFWVYRYTIFQTPLRAYANLYDVEMDALLEE
jgi:serine/threonine protein kinase